MKKNKASSGQFWLDVLQGALFALIPSFFMLFIPILWPFIPVVILIWGFSWPFLKLSRKQQENEKFERAAKIMAEALKKNRSSKTS